MLIFYKTWLVSKQMSTVRKATKVLGGLYTLKCMHSKVKGQTKVKGQPQRQTESNEGNDYLGNNAKDFDGKSYLKKKCSLKYYVK